MDVSNKFLAVLLVVAIVITLIGTIYSVDRLSKLGFISGTDVFGFVNVTISNQTTINVTATNCNFGTGYVTSPYSFAELASSDDGDTGGGGCTDTDIKGNWTNTTAYDPECMAVRNDGNVWLKINMSATKDAAGMIGGTSPQYKVWSQDLEASSCYSGAKNYSSRVDVSTVNVTLCNYLNPSNASDELSVGCYLKVPDNAWGAKSDVWTFWASSMENPAT